MATNAINPLITPKDFKEIAHEKSNLLISFAHVTMSIATQDQAEGHIQ